MSMGKGDVYNVGKREGVLVGKRVDFKIRKETRERAMTV